MVSPPLTLMTWPVMKSERPLAKNNTSSAAAAPPRLRGVLTE